jgi:hypothetical protein
VRFARIALLGGFRSGVARSTLLHLTREVYSLVNVFYAAGLPSALGSVEAMP